MEGKRIKETTEGQILDSGKIGGAFVRGKLVTDNIQPRISVFEQAKQRYLAAIEKHEKPKITITLKDGKIMEGQAFITTPEILAKKISKNLLERSCVARITYTKRYELFKIAVADHEDEEDDQTSDDLQKQKPEFWDLHKPLEGDCEMELFDFDSTEGKSAFWHSSAHIMGQAIELYYGALLCIGPPLSNGFYYDSYIGEDKIVPDDYEHIEKIVDQIIKDKQPFERAVLTKEEALDMFKENPFKVQLIKNKVPEGGYTSVYKSGSLVDLCTGPHLQNTSRVKALKITKHSSAYWLGKNTNDDLQRLYAIAFPKKEQLKEYIKNQEELAKRDHRNIGKQFDLFQFHHFAPGCAFWFPHGAHIYSKLTNLMRHQYQIRGYSEVITPNLYDSHLWKISGHWAKYQDNMFLVKGVSGDEKSIHGLKPMNCPGHCLMFDMKQVSYRELPLRFADFGVLHRNEVHGALSGLTRVRRFQQDDAHIFCRIDQIEHEILGCLDFVDYIYSLFGFKYEIGLSTRPANHLGESELWDKSELMIEEALKKFQKKKGKSYKVNKGDGAFYGPKIDIDLYDAFDRFHQCGTIQLDFNLPIRFNLQYRNDETVEERKKKLSIEEDVPLLQQEKDIVHKLKEIQEVQEEGQSPTKTISEQQKLQKVEEMKSVLKISKKISLDESKDEKKEFLHQHPEIINIKKFSTLSHDTDKTDKKQKYTLQQHELKKGFSRPVIVHRAVLGSLERFIAILCEQTAGKWPFWLSPRQIQIIPINSRHVEYARKVANRIVFEGFNAHVDDSSHKIDKKIRNAELLQYNYMGVVGDNEVENGYVDVRQKGGLQLDKLTVREICKLFKDLDPPMSLEEIHLREKSFFREKVQEFEELNNQLLKTQFLEGNVCGKKDKEIFANIFGKVIDSTKYPHVIRWYEYMEANQGDDLKELDQRLLKNMFLGGNKVSDEDKEIFQRIKNIGVDEYKFPNLARWKSYFVSTEEKQ